MSEPTLIDLICRWRVPLSFVMVPVYFVFARPSARSMAGGCAVAALGLMWRAWASGTIRKDSALAVSGPYRFSRNPLYFGSFLISGGFGWASHQWILFLLILAYFMTMYLPAMKQEERHLENLFGDSFRAYRKRIPLFIPWKKAPPSGDEPHAFNWTQYWRNREYNAVLGYGAAVTLLLLIKYWREI
jgi:protein-S-isoprenylcysteine O-methyltransferase Ste14